MIRGEVGTLTRGGFGATEEVRVDFSDTISNAVVMLTATNGGGNEFSLIVTSVDATGFTFRVSEWEDEDGPHPATETINWIAVTPGVHQLPDGRIIEAGTTTAGTTASSVTLNGDFDAPPIVLTNRMSENDDDVADSDPFNITEDGFSVALQEGSRSDGINTGETVGYIAISPGGDAASGTAVSYDNLSTGRQNFDLGAEFNNGITLAETQTLNEADAGNVQLRNNNIDDEATLFFDEESGDGETSHGLESVGIVTFEQGIIPCYTPGTKVMTSTGERDVTDLKSGDLILTRDSGFAPLRWVSMTRVDGQRVLADRDLCPVLIKQGAFGPGLPCRDMMVSPQHRVLITGWKADLLAGTSEVLVPAKSLLDGRGIVCADPAEVTYFHLLLDTHQVIYANGLPSESLHASQLDKAELSPQARAALFQTLPDLALGYGPTARRCLTVGQGRAFAT